MADPPPHAAADLEIERRLGRPFDAATVPRVGAAFEAAAGVTGCRPSLAEAA